MARIVFVQNIWYEYLGVMYISAMLKKHGHFTDVVIADKSKDIIRELKSIRPDIVAFPCLTSAYQWNLSIAKDIKKDLSCLILFGGIHPTASPEIIVEPGIDVVCRGEGEYPVLELAEAISGKASITGIRNLWVKENGRIYKNELRPLIQDLDELPFPDRDLYLKHDFFKHQEIWHFIAGRGCPFDCTYCHNNVGKEIYKGLGQYVRQRKTEFILREINEFKRKSKMKYVFFSDDVLWIKKDWMMNFLKAYKREVQIPFLCTLTPKATDENIIKALKESGCYFSSIATETGNDRIRHDLLRKRMTNKEYIALAILLHKYEIPFTTSAILGLPGVSLDQALDSVRLNWILKPFYPWASIFQPYAGTWLAEYSIAHGYMSRDDLERLPHDFYKMSVIKQEDGNAIINLHRLFFPICKFPKLMPIFMKLIKLPHNFIYDFIFLVFYSYYIKKAQKLTSYQIAVHGLKWAKEFVRRS
jgi:anaerobic magnesium-protoporphyrin IX monomethyl ester cyclase